MGAKRSNLTPTLATDDSPATPHPVPGDLLAEVSPEQLERILQTADGLGITPQALIRMAIDDFLAQAGQMSYQEAAEYVFAKNTELYRRLA